MGPGGSRRIESILPGGRSMSAAVRVVNRREMLCQCGMGMGAVGLATLLSGVEAASGSEVATGNPLAPRTPPLPARARHVIHLFMNGGPSQVDTFDPKPLLARYDGKTLPAAICGPRARPARRSRRRSASASTGRAGSRSAPVPQSGRHRRHRGHPLDDDDVPNHEPSLMLMNCGEPRWCGPASGPG